MNCSPNIIYLPEIALEKIISFLTFDEVAKNRIVCRTFNKVGSRLLSRGFVQLEKRHAKIYKNVKSMLPRRESERRVHPLSRHCDILQAVETRINMLSMTYTRYIENNVLCFIPGKVLDEMYNVLKVVENDHNPPRTHQLLQELRDLSSMAMEHFDENILPRVKEHKEQIDDRRHAYIAAFSGSPTNIIQMKPMNIQPLNHLAKIRKQHKVYKHMITCLTQSTQKLMQKMQKQNKRLKVQRIKIRDQDRKIQEQSAKIQEQQTSIADIKRHMVEWDQKYKELTTELTHAKEYIIKKTYINPMNSIYQPSIKAKPYRSCIRPRRSDLFISHNPNSVSLEMYRKRRSNIIPEVPVKIKPIDVKEQNTESDPSIEKRGKSSFSLLIENLIKTPLTGIKSRKRKMPQDIVLGY